MKFFLFSLSTILLSLILVPSSDGAAAFASSPSSSTTPPAATSAQETQRRRVSLVTGASGYVGREIVHTILSNDDDDINDDVICLVRSSKVEDETSYWSSVLNTKGPSKRSTVRVMPYDMLDGGESLNNALCTAYKKHSQDDDEDSDDTIDYCVYHLACIFGPTQNHIQTAHDAITGVTSTVQTVSKYNRCKLILTSSMAAVRGTGQTPSNGKYYTHRDWNTMSKLEDDSWGSSYQWSKTESERVTMQLAKELNVPMVSLNPSFVFGPSTFCPSSSASSSSKSYSLTLVGQWIRGESPVQSRLCIDVRDVAKAHVYMGKQPLSSSVWNEQERFILSTEARISSTDIAKELQKVAASSGGKVIDPNAIYADTDFKGGAIPIGEKEVDCADRLRQYFGGLVCRSVEETFKDMGRFLLIEME